jgi:hypothetical protein
MTPPMPIDLESFRAPATKGDVAGVAIQTVVALWAIIQALEEIKKGKDISAHIESITACTQGLDEMFNKLTGWTKPE